MLESLNVRILNQDKVTLTRPNEISVLEEGKEKEDVFTIEKSASKYLYKQLDASLTVSKELYKKNEPMWKQYIEMQLSSKDDKPAPFKFEDKELRYVVDENGSLVDVCCLSDEYFETLKDKLETFLMEINSNEHTGKFCYDDSNGLTKLIMYRTVDDTSNPGHKIAPDFTALDYVPMMILEVNNKKSEYSIYTGIIMYKDNSLLLVPSMNPVATYESFIDFVLGVNLLGTLELSESNAEGLYNAYLDFKSSHIEISARELIRVLNKAGYKLQLKEDSSLDDIEKLQDDESNLIIKKFFNSFVLSTGETAEDILNLSEIKKVFKYNKLTILDLLQILSNEYLKDGGAKVTTQLLSDLVFGLYTKKIDATDAKGIIDDINNR